MSSFPKDVHVLVLEPVNMLDNCDWGFEVANGINIVNQLTLK